MKVVYGLRGQPVGSVDEDFVYRADGTTIGFRDDSFIYNFSDGKPLGSFVSGVVFDTDGVPQAFSKGCSKSIPPLPPKRPMLPPRLAALGKDVSDLPSVELPEFFDGQFSATKTSFLDGSLK